MSSNDKSGFQRKFIRAPMHTACLYVDGDFVFKAKTNNISEGGVLLSELPHFPEINALPLMLSIPLFPKLSLLTLDQLKAFSFDDLPRKIVKVKSKMVRNFEGKSNVDKIFIHFIAVEFHLPDEKAKEAIIEYVETFTKNTVYLLSLFESLGNRAEHIELLRTVAHVLGYDRQMKIPILRAKVLHDYQSLESL